MGTPDKLRGSLEMDSDRKYFAIISFHKNRRLGFLESHRSKRMPIFRQADKAGLYVGCC